MALNREKVNLFKASFMVKASSTIQKMTKHILKERFKMEQSAKEKNIISMGPLNLFDVSFSHILYNLYNFNFINIIKH